ncbi:hypothetical protein Sste5346_010336 [Sporothrix stenoceras]|uniref:Metallo-beta-lactamase domain-containing protein n=1 Tax=Sporothrix stenoceras TaxID=5173 RepID=A0ABR3YG00_9PEZI
MSSQRQLPAASGTVEIVLLDGGGFRTTEDWRLHEGGHSRPFFLYDWCFFIQHKASGRKILWDLGISKDRSLYTPSVLANQWVGANPVGPRIPLTEQLKAIGHDPAEIDTVIFSHAHWDHCRPLRSEFPNASALFGPGTIPYCRPGHIQNLEPTMASQWDSRFFSDDENVRTESCSELDGHWAPWGPFDAAMDYFGDCSFWIIQAPGHMPGNLAACVRHPSGEHILLGSDCCHSRAIFDGRSQIAVSGPDSTKLCLHLDLDAALETIEKLREAVNSYGMHLALAHDPEFIREVY